MTLKGMSIKNLSYEIHVFKTRCFTAILFVLFFLCLLLGRLAYLQIRNHRFYTTLSRHNLLSVIPIEPNRGLILDRNGIILTKNIPSYTLAIIRHGTKDLPHTIKKIKSIIPISDEELARFHHIRSQYRSYQPIPLKLKLTEEAVSQFYVNQYRLPGVRIQTHMTRYYPSSDTMSNVLGYLGSINKAELQKVEPSQYLIDDDIGKSGIEKQYETLLRGVMGAEEAEIDASGRIVRTLNRIPPQSGHNIYLTIDSRLQAQAMKALKETHTTGAVVALDPRNGQVLTLVGNPSYDSNLFTQGLTQASYQALLHDQAHPLYDRAIYARYSPGSSIKPFLAFGGLNDGLITPEERFHDIGWFKVPNTSHVYHDWKKGGHGWIDMVKAIAASCDIYFYVLSYKMGIHRIHDILHAFGFGEKTGIDIPGESVGVVPSKHWKRIHRQRPWYIGDTIVIGIGQGFLSVTMLQLAQAVATIAMHGQRFKPQLLLKVEKSDKGIILNPPVPKASLILNNASNWNTIIQAMQDVLTKPWGTAHSFGYNGFTAAGKTGTVQLYAHTQAEYKRRRATLPTRLKNNHLFIAFAPVDHPSIAIAVISEHSYTAIRIARSVMTEYFKNLTLSTPSNENGQPNDEPVELPIPL